MFRDQICHIKCFCQLSLEASIISKRFFLLPKYDMSEITQDFNNQGNEKRENKPNKLSTRLFFMTLDLTEMAYETVQPCTTRGVCMFTLPNQNTEFWPRPKLVPTVLFIALKIALTLDVKIAWVCCQHKNAIVWCSQFQLCLFVASALVLFS